MSQEDLTFDGEPTPDACLDAFVMRHEQTPDALPGRLRGGHDARQMAQLRWERQRARQAASREDTSADEDDEVRKVHTPVRIGRIIRALETEAVQGNAHAARELRAWLDEYPPKDDSISLDDLDRRTRDRLLARLLAELEEEDASSDLA